MVKLEKGGERQMVDVVVVSVTVEVGQSVVTAAASGCFAAQLPLVGEKERSLMLLL